MGKQILRELRGRIALYDALLLYTIAHNLTKLQYGQDGSITRTRNLTRNFPFEINDEAQGSDITSQVTYRAWMARLDILHG
jgi:hypothetical protein